MSAEETHQHSRMQYGRFFVAVILQLALAVWVFSQIAPGAFRAELNSGFGAIALWTLLLGIPMSLFEYLYHRYLLHSAVLPFLGEMHKAHSTHHGLTYVKAPVTPHEPARLVEVKSAYPVEEEHQEDSMMFPLWSLSIFFVVFLILFAWPLKAIFPSQPVILGTIFSVFAYYVAYEVWHAILHLPYERFWKPVMDGRYTSKLFRRMYSFHLMHHWRPTSNLAVVGLWGIAVWDHLFRTHRRPGRLPLNKATVTFEDAVLPKPVWPISMLDKWQPGMYKGSRAIERFLARIFLRKRSNP